MIYDFTCQISELQCVPFAILTLRYSFPTILRCKRLEVERFARQLHDAADNDFAADAIIIRYIGAHAALRLRTVNATQVVVAAFVHVHDVAVTLVEEQVAPRQVVDAARKGQVAKTTFRLGFVKRIQSIASWACTAPDKLKVTYSLFAQVTEIMSSHLMLNETTLIVRVTVIA